jgi:cytochrome c5
MCGEAPPRSNAGFRWIAIASVLLAALSAGCRTAAGGGMADAEQALKAISTRSEAAEIAALPEGQAKSLVTERCLLCHSAGLITQQRKDAAAWQRTVTQMRTWGSPIQEDEQKPLVAYLLEHFGPAGARR